jgi:hypothetical protein
MVGIKTNGRESATPSNEVRMYQTESFTAGAQRTADG